LKFPQVITPENKKAERDRFMQDYLQMDNNGGIVVTDSKMEYAPLEMKPYIIDDKQLNATKTKIYEYLGISEKIVNGSYNEDDWGSYYSSVIEPIALQLSLAFTEMIFTQREQAFGNTIMFESNRLQYASASTKTELLRVLMPMKLLTRNEAREILGLPGVPDGDEFVQSLNFVSGNIADKYQLGDMAELVESEEKAE
jgi:hypothetical protein